MNDSLRRDDFAPAPPPAPVKMRAVKRYQIMYTTADGRRRPSMRLYELALARKLVARLNRKGYADAYASPLTVNVPR